MISFATLGSLLLLTVAVNANIESSAAGEASGESLINSINNMFGPFGIFPPQEHIPDRPNRRYVEWYKQFKTNSYIEKDTAMSVTGSVDIGPDLVGLHFTISAILPGEQGDNIYILRRRQDPDNVTSEFSADGTYARKTEGAIQESCVLNFNLSTGSLINSFGDDVFYYPNAMVRNATGGEFWFSDAGRHQVLRMNSSNAVADPVIGTLFSPGKGTTRLCAPTDVAITTRHVYVADGFCNDRVVMFNVYGDYIAEFGKAPSPSLLTAFNLAGRDDGDMIPMRYIKRPQAVAVDELRDRLYIAESGQSRVVIVKAGDQNESTFGTGIRYIQHPQLSPVASRIALHPSSPLVFVLNSFNHVELHRGFTFNTHNVVFRGAWGSDDRGFVRSRAIAVSLDGSTIYVADATEETPEKIWIFNRTENLRARRTTGNNQKGDEGQQPTNHKLTSTTADNNEHTDAAKSTYNIKSSITTTGDNYPGVRRPITGIKGVWQQRQANIFYQSIYRYLSLDRIKGGR